MTVRMLKGAAGVVVAVLALAVGFVTAMRFRYAPVQRLVRRTNRRLVNPRQLDSDAGGPGAHSSVVHHVGRRSGRAYRTPVVVVPTDEGLVIALPYGRDTDWVHNILAAGSATVEHDGETLLVDSPEFVGRDRVEAAFSPAERRVQRLFGIDEFLLLHRAGPAAAPQSPGSGSDRR